MHLASTSKKKKSEKENLIPVRWMCPHRKDLKTRRFEPLRDIFLPHFFFFSLSKRENGAEWKVLEFAADKHFLICCAGGHTARLSIK
jgi:hypothetical protein